MSRGARINPQVRGLITEKALENRNKPRRDVAVELQSFIKKMGYPVPTFSTLEKYISEDRGHPSSADDNAWTLVTSDRRGIPIQATPMLLRWWSLCLLKDEVLTIRQAKWAARLQPLFNEETYLYICASWYANQERFCDVNGLAMDTSIKDANLVMGRWLLVTADKLDRVERYADIFETEEKEPMFRTASIQPNWPEMSLSNSVIDVVLSESLTKEEKDKEYVFGKYRKQLAIRSDKNPGISTEAKLVGLAWSNQLVQSPRWPDMSLEERGRIVNKLLDWIEEHPWAISQETMPHRLLNISRSPLSKPLEVFKEVGVNLENMTFHRHSRNY